MPEQVGTFGGVRLALYRTSRPHAPGAAPIWTTYTHDGAGPTVAVTAPGSVTSYVYEANSTKTTADFWRPDRRCALV